MKYNTNIVRQRRKKEGQWKPLTLCQTHLMWRENERRHMIKNKINKANWTGISKN